MGSIEGTVDNVSKDMFVVLREINTKKNTHKTKIDPDGYYILENVTQGNYTIILTNIHGKELDSKKVKITRHEPFIYDVNLHVPFRKEHLKIETLPSLKDNKIIDKQSLH